MLDEVFLNTPLTKREIDVLNELVKGYSLKGIAKQLNVSRDTVGTHCLNIYAKLGITKDNGNITPALVAGLWWLRENYIASEEK